MIVEVVRVGNVAQVIFNHWIIIGEGLRTHKHEVLLVAEGVFQKAGFCLVERQAAKVLPGALGVEIPIPGIKVALGGE